jgi:dihydrofolate synthase/folylpolyglutamate synthase
VPQRFDTLDQWLAWFETLHPKKIDFSLSRVRAVLDALDIATPPYRVITVGGTNGKGSCVAMLESIYREAGYRVGAFTSPHLWRFNERLRLDAKAISDTALIELFELMDAARGTITLSYFEASAVAAMLFYARARVDLAILEVGMGGRLDAVNVYDADAALIVSIDLDHEEWLGSDRDAIGREKAGIMRAGRPVVVADADPPTSILEAAASLGAELKLIGRDFSVESEADGLIYRVSGRADERLPRPSFGVRAQLQNAAACIAIVDALGSSLPVDRAAVGRGLKNVRIAGRLDRHTIDGVEWIFDVAHNPAAAARMLDALESSPPAERTWAVFGAMRDKDLAGVMRGFVSAVGEWFVAPVESERGASPDSLCGILSELGAVASAHADVAAACEAARRRAAPGDRVLVFGSFYTVGPALAALGLYSPALFEG